MHNSLVAILLLCPTLATQVQQIPGETPVPAGQPPASSFSQAEPASGTGTLPASLRNAFGNSNNNIPFSWTPSSYQQVFLGSEMPPALAVIGLGLRQDDQFANYTGYYIDMEMSLGYTTYDPATLTNTFASNFNSGPPVVVITRKQVAQPSMPPTVPTDPGVFFHQIRFDRPWIWAQVAGRNLLIEVRNHGNGNNSAIFTYPLDAGSGVTTTRLYGLTGPGDLTGTLGASYGMVMCFLDKIKTTGAYSTYGQGCKGTGGHSGHIVPTKARTSMLNSANAWTLGTSNQHWQQEIDATAMPSVPTRFINMAFRDDEVNRTATANTMTLQILVGMTTYSSTTLTGTYATNATGPQTTVFNGNVNIPGVTGGNTDPNKFVYVIPFTTPYLYLPKPGENFLVEIVNTTAAPVTRYPDAEASTAAEGARVYANPATATTGTVGLNHCMAICFGTGGAGNAVPILGNNGRPVINKSFDVTLASAKVGSAAVLILGVSDSQWGAFTLPLDLTAAGAPGCKLLASYDLGLPTPTANDGTGKVTLALPNDVSLANLVWFNQYAVIDAPANALGLAFTNGGKATVGEQ